MEREGRLFGVLGPGRTAMLIATEGEINNWVSRWISLAYVAVWRAAGDNACKPQTLGPFQARVDGGAPSRRAWSYPGLCGSHISPGCALDLPASVPCCSCTFLPTLGRRGPRHATRRSLQTDIMLTSEPALLRQGSRVPPIWPHLLDRAFATGAAVGMLQMLWDVVVPQLDEVAVDELLAQAFEAGRPYDMSAIKFLAARASFDAAVEAMADA